MAESENFHGYVWRSDGAVHDVPEPPQTGPMTATEAHTRATEQSKGRLPHVTQEQYDRAFATWVREFTAWQADMAAWREKHGRK